ncbi:thiamine phosphate synthase [Maribacter sp. 1_MG-2023]|uniref:thiamine phosphate synthase n=1 Tax=Maribacter sp. 1_MG-2023 TaxID=3062677 RepID=UPI0026E43F08|nr:thiamine phosphate synthase [Maribacter sp. 1_MG-2023]MDO6472793.1 thiamine phosphate synthase [Maribacter sp. 1_MG-2023]
MIVLIAPEKDIPNEIELLHQLFQEGLAYYHLRKPLKDYQEHCDYLNAIDTKYHNRIVVHFFHELINVYDLKGVHFQEQKRIDHIDNPGQYFKSLDMYGKTISSSFHDPKVLEDCEFEFDYHLLSPVFSSISKQGYEGKGFNVNQSEKLIVGMGGITDKTVQQTLKLGFKGIGVLGGVWNMENPVESFVALKKQYETAVQEQKKASIRKKNF